MIYKGTNISSFLHPLSESDIDYKVIN